MSVFLDLPLSASRDGAVAQRLNGTGCVGVPLHPNRVRWGIHRSGPSTANCDFPSSVYFPFPYVWQAAHGFQPRPPPLDGWCAGITPTTYNLEPVHTRHVIPLVRCRVGYSRLSLRDQTYEPVTNPANGTRGGIRIPDPRLRRPMLYPLSYTGVIL